MHKFCPGGFAHSKTFHCDDLSGSKTGHPGLLVVLLVILFFFVLSLVINVSILSVDIFLIQVNVNIDRCLADDKIELCNNAA